MTTLAPPTQPIAPPKVSKGTVPIALGSVLAVIGALLALGGSAVFAVFGGDGAADTGRNQIATPTAALVSGVATIDDTADAAVVIGDPSFRVTADPGVFVGVGPAREVERYLHGAPIDRVTDLDVDPLELSKDRRGGDARPAPPTEQSFWVAQARNGEQLDWKVTDGDYRLVVMNADGSRGVVTDASFEIELPGMPGLGLGILGIGILFLGGGLVLVVVGSTRR